MSPLNDAIFVSFTSCEAILSQGIVFAEFDNFAETRIGQEFLKMHSFVFAVPKDAYLFVLFGYLARPVHHKLREEKGAVEVALAWSLPFLCSKWWG